MASRRSISMNVLVTAALMGFYGFYFAPVGVSDSSFYNGTVDALRHAMQAGCIVLVLAAGAGMAGFSAAAIIDVGANGLVGLMTAIIGGYWVVVDRDWTSAILVLFGLVCLHNARLAWGAYSAGVRAARIIETSKVGLELSSKAIDHAAAAPPADTTAPAPVDGYLAALGRAGRGDSAHTKPRE